MGAKNPADSACERVRIDKWLWAARFFKTRSLAAVAIKNSKIKLHGRNVKVSTPVAIDDLLLIRSGPYQREYRVLALSDVRGPATAARSLYRETTASVERNALLKQSIASQPRIERSRSKPGKRAIRSGRILKRGD